MARLYSPNARGPGSDPHMPTAIGPGAHPLSFGSGSLVRIKHISKKKSC